MSFTIVIVFVNLCFVCFFSFYILINSNSLFLLFSLDESRFYWGVEGVMNGFITFIRVLSISRWWKSTQGKKVHNNHDIFNHCTLHLLFFKRDSFFINIFLLEWYIYRVSSSFASMMPRSDMNVSERNMKSGYEKIKDKIIKYMNIDENEVCIFLLTDQSTQFDPRILIQRICFIDFFLSTKILRKQNMKNCVKRLIGRLNKNVFCLIIGIDCL